MPIPLTASRYYTLNAGINENISELSKDKAELASAQNVDFFVRNAVRKRNGYIRRISSGVNSTNAITGLFEFRLRSGTNYFVATSGAQLRYDNAGTWTDITGAVTITGGQDNKFSFDTYDDILIATNGVDAPIQWTGAGNAAALAGSPPSAMRWVAHYNEHVFLARNATNRSRVYISNQGDPQTWGASDFFDVGQDDGQEITGLVTLYDRMFIFKTRSIYQLSGTSIGNFRVDLVSQNVGCISGWSLAVVENAILFLSDRGFYEFTGSVPALISDKIQTTLLALNTGRTQFSHGTHYKRRFQYWCAVSNGSSTTHNLVLVYDYLQKAWTKFTGINANAFGIEQTTNSSMERLYHGDYSSIVFNQDSGNVDDDSTQTAISANFTTHPIDMGSPELFKRFRYLRMFFDQQGTYNVTVSYLTDFGTQGTSTSVSQSLSGTQSLWGTMTWGVSLWGGAAIIRPRANLRASGHHIEVTVANNSANQPFVLHGFSILARIKGPKRVGVS